MQGPLPVQVWLHGGAFVFGSSSKREYDAERIIDLERQPMVSCRLGFFYVGGGVDAAAQTTKYVFVSLLASLASHPCCNRWL
jgi:carboxylesterase type B